MYGQLVSLLAKGTRIIDRRHVSDAGPACQSGFVQEPCVEIQDVSGIVDEEHGRGTLFQSCGRWRDDCWFSSALPT